MAVQNPFFGRREPETLPSRPAQAVPVSSLSSMAPSTVAVAASAQPTTSATAEVESAGSKLTVGPNIKLKGVEITDCDTLVVEGTVEATMDSRVIQITEQGAFHGSAEIDLAEIHGEFSGTLTVRKKLVIFSTGRVSGKIRYGKLVVEEGGQLSGEIAVGVGNSNSNNGNSGNSSSNVRAVETDRAAFAGLVSSHTPVALGV
ncbi:MAG: polymer-forming cytoskeletal protein [Burkholderiaceae bacterium]|nr:polymer-forming cytoskeletal protein [Burkholderiaceae bacterium]